MSSMDDAATLIAEYSDLRLSNYVGIVSCVVFLYECVITIGGEVELFWFAKWTGATILFLLNRYIVGFYSFYILATSFVPSSQAVCDASIKFIRMISVAQYLPWAAFSALRALALSQNWPLATIIFLLSCLPVGVNMAQFHFGLGGVIIPVYNCVGTYNMPPWMMPTLTVISRACLITADISVIIITWRRLHGPNIGRSKLTFAHVLRRDGIVYFICIAILNALHLALTALSTLDAPLEDTSYVTFFTEPLTGIIVGRFLLHLQAANRKALDMQSSIHSEVQGASLIFAQAMGSLVSSIGLEDSEDSDFTRSSDDSTKAEVSTDVSL